MRTNAADPIDSTENNPSASPEAKHFSSLGKTRATGLILAGAVIAFFVIANLPFQYVEAETYWRGGHNLGGATSVSRYGLYPVAAGWPLNYSVRYQLAGLDQQRYWSTLALLVNVALAIASAVVVFHYLQLRQRRIQQSFNPGRTRLLFDLGIGAAMLLIPALVFGTSYRKAVEHDRLARQLARHGNAQLSVWIPAAMVDHVPTGIRKLFFRLRQVRVFSLPDELEQEVIAVDSLVSLGAYGDDVQTASLHRLKDHLHLSELSLSRRELTEEDMDAIASLPWLARLQLSSTNLNAPLLRKLDRLRLLEVDLSRTPLRLAELGRPDWADTVLDLKLARPPQGVSDTLRLEKWPNLTRLSVRRSSPNLNPEPMELILVDLPELELVQLDRLQKHRLVLRNLPRLVSVDEAIEDLRFLLGSNDQLPGLTWVSELDVENTASLTTLTAFARDLDSISVRKTPSLKSLSIGSFLTTVHGGRRKQPADRDHCQRWIRELGRRDGPSTLDLSALPLAGVDLSPLSKNQRVRRLLLNDTEIEFDQLRGLDGMQQLEQLRVRSCLVESHELKYLLDQFPKLRELSVDGSPLTEIELDAGLSLRRLELPPLPALQRLTLTRLPMLRTFLRVGPNIRHLTIRDAASLRGLAVEAPWRDNFELEGLRDLSWFAGGGPALDDEVVDVLLPCSKLDDLTLAYASVSRPMLRAIGQLKSLTVLAVPGADVDDEIIKDWSSLENLWEVNLDDTRVGGETIAWLSRQKSLRRVSLNRVPLSEMDAVMLGQLRQLSQLCLADVDVPLKCLQPLLVAGNLESLDLSGRPLDAEVRELLNCSHGLRHLVMRNSAIDPEALSGILQDHSSQNRELYVDVGELPPAIDNEVAAELNRRGIDVRDDFVRGWQNAFRGMRLISITLEEKAEDQLDSTFEALATSHPVDSRQTMQIRMPPTMARIDVEPFRRPHSRMSEATGNP